MARYKAGTVFELNIDGIYYYAQSLHYGNMAYFDYRSDKPIVDILELTNAPVLFVAYTHSYILTKKLWKKVGYLDIREELKDDIIFFIYSKVDGTFEKYSSKTGEVFPSSLEDCRGLEICAVWDKNHIEDRIRDYYLGVPCVWLNNIDPFYNPSLLMRSL